MRNYTEVAFVNMCVHCIELYEVRWSRLVQETAGGGSCGVKQLCASVTDTVNICMFKFSTTKKINCGFYFLDKSFIYSLFNDKQVI